VKKREPKPTRAAAALDEKRRADEAAEKVVHALIAREKKEREERSARLREKAETLRNTPKWAEVAERQARPSLEHALFHCTAAILDALADLAEAEK
jgi:hypothetical protein